MLAYLNHPPTKFFRDNFFIRYSTRQTGGTRQAAESMEDYSAIKKNTFESVLMRWMKLELIIQSEVTQKEKHQYSILIHIYGI